MFDRTFKTTGDFRFEVVYLPSVSKGWHGQTRMDLRKDLPLVPLGEPQGGSEVEWDSMDESTVGGRSLTEERR